MCDCCSTIENESANIQISTVSFFLVKTIARLLIVALHVACGYSSDKFAAVVIWRKNNSSWKL